MNTQDDKLTPLEQAVLSYYLAEAGGEEQWDVTTFRVKSREFTELGFFTRLDEMSAPRVAPPGKNLHWGKVGARLNGGQAESSYVVFVEDGLVATLEGYTYGDEWPRRIDDFEVYEEKQGE